VPKTIDNDINMLARSFGFDTAVATPPKSSAPLTSIFGRAQRRGAGQADGARIRVHRRLRLPGSGGSQLRLVPEADFDLDGPKGLLVELEQRLKRRKHAVIVVAEGAGQKFFDDQPDAYDPSGNRKLGDIGRLLADRIKEYFKGRKVELNLKYFDPAT
jgi:6-phosphofructokinase 1